ncbi:hypothetical protein HF313_13040 [Massilia atriviolacea]|uniref:Fimbrial assembly protein n=1 Tax=Massilia atriviolacea TaxID=2495579 RepID=A0A430HQ72_9BURK|nr:hypothetical protein [Massilia atriviolacea]RSZ59671.1 hypothetical protein EJB06_05590 [Massilia atriviolacea]
MKPMMIDFADQRSVWRWDWRMRGTQLGLGFTVLAMLLGGLAFGRGLRIEHELQEARAAQAARQAASEQREQAERRRAQPLADEAQLLRQSMLQRAQPWEEIFGAFERVPQARLQSFEPDLARGVIKVQANMDDVAGLQAYLRSLKGSPVFTRLSLMRHEAAAEGGINFHYEAQLSAPYRLPDSEARSAP